MKKIINVFCFMVTLLLFTNLYADYNTPIFYYTPTAFSTKTTGATNLFTTLPPKFVPTTIVIASGITTAITVPATISIGTNSPTCNNILGATLLLALTTGNFYNISLANSLIPIIPSATTVCANVTIAATGTSQNILIGMLGAHQ